MKHLTLGTAGHVDHGKTALIKTITGFDCDTHKAEKERGITINLGFTHVTLPSGNMIGIVDVPGHEDFIHTMVEGAMGIDLGLLVIAANEGVMQQTREHVNIMGILGIERVLVVITKIDLVDEVVLEKVEHEIKLFLKNSYLKDAPIIKVSVFTKDGIEQLISQIDDLASRQDERPATGPFRLFIDRVFSKPGAGVVVTGSAINGTLTRDKKIYLLPGNNAKVGVRAIQRFGTEVSSISAGDRTAINLSGVKKRDVKRGMVISDQLLNTTSMIDVKISLNQGIITLRSHSDIMFQAGDYNIKAGINILTSDILHGGETGFAQIKLPVSCILRHGDHFIVRSSSGDKTVGGGYILDITPLHHKRRRDEVVTALDKIDAFGVAELTAQKVRRVNKVFMLDDVADKMNFSVDELASHIENNLPDDIINIKAEKIIYLLSAVTMAILKKTIIDKIALFFTDNPFAGNGPTREELAISLPLDNISEAGRKELIQLLLLQLKIDKKVEEKDGYWTIPGLPKEKNYTVDPKQAGVENFIKECGERVKVPTNPELDELRLKLNISEKEMKQIIAQLIKEKSIYSSEKAYIHKETVKRIRKILIDSLIDSDEGITVAAFRDMIAGNRKICLALLTLFDNEGTTIRKENSRFLSARTKREIS